MAFDINAFLTENEVGVAEEEPRAVTQSAIPAKQTGFDINAFLQENAVSATPTRIAAEESDQPFFALEDAVSAIGTIPEALSVGVPAAFQKLVTGTAMPEESEAMEKDIAFQERMRQEQQDRQAAGKSSMVGEAIREAAPSIATSFGGLGAGIAGAVGGTVVGGPVGATVGGMAASGTASYRMAAADLLYRSFKALEEQKGSPLTEEEKAQAYKEFLPLAQNSALWEAGPEAVSNAVLLGAGKFVFGFGKPLARKLVGESIERVNKGIASKVAAGTGAVAAELGTETITALGQFAPEMAAQKYTRTGTTEGAPTEYPGGAMQAFKDVAPATLALTGMMAGAGGVVKAATLPFQKAKTPEQIAEDNINLDAEREADNLLIPDNDEQSKSIKSQIDTERADLAIKKELYNTLPDGDKTKAVLATEIKEYEGRITELDNTLRQRLGLSLPITTAEQQQIELARAITAPSEAAPTEKPKAKIPPPPPAIITDSTTEEQIASEISTRKSALNAYDFGTEANNKLEAEINKLEAELQSRKVTPAPPTAEAPAITPAPAPATISTPSNIAPNDWESAIRSAPRVPMFPGDAQRRQTVSAIPILKQANATPGMAVVAINGRTGKVTDQRDSMGIVVQMDDGTTERMNAFTTFHLQSDVVPFLKTPQQTPSPSSIQTKPQPTRVVPSQVVVGDTIQLGGSPRLVTSVSNEKGITTIVATNPETGAQQTLSGSDRMLEIEVVSRAQTQSNQPAPVAETPAVSPAPEVAPVEIEAVHFSRTPMKLEKGVDVSKIKGAYEEESTFGRGFYAAEKADESMWKGMDRFQLGDFRNEVKITPKNPLIISPQTIKELGYDAIKDRFDKGNYDAIITRGWSEDTGNKISQRVEQLWTPKFPSGKTSGRFTNVEEFRSANEQAIKEITGLSEYDYTNLDKQGWNQNQIFIPPDTAPDIVSPTPAVSETITPAKPAGKLARGRKGEAGGVLIPSREDFIQAGQNIYEKGMEFGTWAKQMVQRFGDAVRQFLGDVWEAVSGFPAKLEEMAGYLPGKGERGAVTFGRGEEPKNMDAGYLAAVERGDMETAQRMVDEAAKAAGRRNESGALINLDTGVVISESHAGVPIKQNWQDNVTFNDAGISAITTGDSPVAITHTHPDESGLSDSDMRMLGWSNVKKVQAVTPSGVVYTITKPEGSSAYPRKIEDTWNKIEDEIFESGRSLEMSVPQIIREINIRASNELGFIYSESENQLHPLKLESITYDDAGNVIPLSRRFVATTADIRGEAAPQKPAEPTPVTPTEPAPEKPITDPATPDEQTQQLVQQAQEQESLVDSAVKEAGTTVFDVFNRLVNEGKTEDQVAKELGISNYDVRKYKLRADTAILNKMKQKKVKPLAFAPKNPVAEFAEKNLRKYFTKEGWLPKAVFQSWVKRNAALSSEQKEAEFAIKDLYAGIREVFGISKMEMITKGLVSVPPEFVQQLNDALAGKIDINTMPEPVREPLTRMRQHIDAMSRQLVDLNVLPDELAAKISANLGVYLTRSYKIFTDKNWINKIPTEKLTAARNFLYQQQLKNDPEATIEMADRELRNMLNDWASDAEGLRKRGGKLGAKDLSVMMERAKVPKVLREVMGENTNVIFNYANTIGKISRFVSDQKFLNEVKAKGTGEFLFTEKDAPKGFNTQIAAEESRTMSPLNGLRTTPEIAKAFEEFGKGYDIRENPGLRLLAWMNAVGKLNLTVGSVLTQMRNMLGQPAFFVFNGHYNWRVIRQEIDAIAKEKGISQEDAKKELVKLAAAQGLVNENAYAGELRTAFQDVGLETFDDIGPDEFTKQFVLTRMYLKGVKSAQELYQKTDEFGKLVGWLNETKRIQRMNKGMDKQTAQSIAAERTRDTYPTYSQSSEALRLFRRQPFIGPFATFFYETFRTSFHNLRYAFEDINGPTPEHKAEGIKRLAGAMTTLSMGAFGINLLSKLASGIGDEEEEDVRRMLPSWAKDASLAWMPKSKDGTYNFINVSYINPYNAMTDPFIAMMSGFAKGDKPEEIAVQALGSFLSPFTSEQPVTATIGDAARNRTSTGKQIYNPQDDITTKTSKIMLHIFGKTFTPGTITRLRERIIPAIQGETVGTRAPAPAKEIAAELTGIRFETLDMKAAFSSKAWEFSRAANESERIFRDVATRRRRVDEQEQVDAYRRSEQTRYEIWNDMYRDYMAVRRAGASQGEAVRLMTDIGISKKEAIAISKGRYVPYEVSNEVLRRSKLNENKVPIKEIRVIGKEMPRVLTDITKTP